MEKPFYDEGGVTLHHGNALDVLKQMPDESVDCCITSPPYWGLRAYGTEPQIWGGDPNCEHDWLDTSYRDSRKTDVTAGDKQRTNYGATGWRDALRQNATCLHCDAWSGELGLEPTPTLFVKHMVMVLEEVRRVLKPDGTSWINLGDSYCSARGNPGPNSIDKKQSARRGYERPQDWPMDGFKQKDLIGIPWRVAFALQEAGWWLRSDIIWAKPAPMPESVTDRPTRSHEYIFLLAKSERYYYDHEAIKERSVAEHGSGNGFKRPARLSFADEDGARGSDIPWQPKSWNSSQFDGHRDLTIHPNVGRKPRTAKVHGNIPARDDGGGACNGPGQEFRNKRDVWTVNTDPFSEAHFATFPPALIRPCVLAGCPEGGTILDPFSGAATTALVAKENGRRAVGIELNEEYLEISKRRLSQEVLAF